MRVTASLLLLSVLLPTSGAAQEERFPMEKVDIERFDTTLDLTRDLSSYSTYAWSRSQVPVENMANHIRIIQAVQKELQDLGFRIDTVRPDLRIEYKVTRSQTVQSESTQQRSVWDDANSVVNLKIRRDKQVSLTLEMVEADSNFLVWQGKGTYPEETPDKAVKLIPTAVGEIFATFPRPEDAQKP